ncbi:MAG: hypothetical protein LIR46_07180 [Bacteroidota bacterium]|nr:hypothetical protein [Bacteroidota bacterium]
MKKFLALILVALMVLAMFVACTDKKEGGDETTVEPVESETVDETVEDTVEDTVVDETVEDTVADTAEVTTAA